MRKVRSAQKMAQTKPNPETQDDESAGCASSPVLEAPNMWRENLGV